MVKSDNLSFYLDYAERVLFKVHADEKNHELSFTIESPNKGRVAHALAGMTSAEFKDSHTEWDKHPRDAAGNVATLPLRWVKTGEHIDVAFNKHNFFRLTHTAQGWEVSPSRRKLTATETRIIGRSPQHAIPSDLAPSQDQHLLTDLHTHLSGQLSGKRLIELALKHAEKNDPPMLARIAEETDEAKKLELNKKLTLYPVHILQNWLGIDCTGLETYDMPRRQFLPLAHIEKNNEKFEKGVLLTDLAKLDEKRARQALEEGKAPPESVYKILDRSFDLDVEKQNNFSDLEYCYFRREALSKNPVLLPDILRAIAAECKDQGIKYIELSATSLNDPNWFKVAEDTIADMEARDPFGPKLRLLAGLPRNLPAVDDDKRAVNALLSKEAKESIQAIDKAKNFSAEERDSHLRAALPQDMPEHLQQYILSGGRPDKPQDIQERLVDYINNCKHSKYVAGFDWLGFETNKTSDIDHCIKDVNAWIQENRPDWVQRIHAGENSKNPDNVDHCLRLVRELGPKANIRIGHATHGVTDETFKLAKQLLADGYHHFGIEALIDSNIANNTTDNYMDSNLKKFLDIGVPSFPGSDGAGLYGVNSEQIVHSARMAGLSQKDIAKIIEHEDQFIGRRMDAENKFEATKKRALANDEEYAEAYEPEFHSRKNTAPEVPFDRMIPELPKDERRPIFLMGSNGSSWQTLSEADKEKAETFLRELIINQRIDPAKHYLVLGRLKPEKGKAEDGQDGDPKATEGLGNLILKIVKEYNDVRSNAAAGLEAPKKLDCFVLSTRGPETQLPEEVTGFVQMKVAEMGVTAESIRLLQEQRVSLRKVAASAASGEAKPKKPKMEKPPIAIAVSGGTFTRDMIKDIKEADWPLALVDVHGASAQKLKIYDKNAVRTPEDIRQFIEKSEIACLPKLLGIGGKGNHTEIPGGGGAAGKILYMR